MGDLCQEHVSTRQKLLPSKEEHVDAGSKVFLPPDGFYEMDIGVWHVVRPKASPLLSSISRRAIAEQIRGMKPMLLSLWWFLHEIYQLSPIMCLAWVLAEVSVSLIPALSTYVSTSLLSLVGFPVTGRCFNFIIGRTD